MNSLCSIRLSPKEGSLQIDELTIFSMMYIMEKRLRERSIGVAQILTNDKMYCGVMQANNNVEWTEISYDDCFDVAGEEES
jgi:hypothetical protein